MDNILYDLKKILDENFTVSIQDNNASINKLQNRISIIAEVEKNIKNDTIIIIKEIVHDLESGIYSATNALYRNAFVCLRSGIELSLAYIYFVDHNYDYLFWQKDEFELTWSAIKDENSGILRHKYLSLFVEDDFSVLIHNYIRLYHECSQSVHGKYAYMFSTQLTNLRYSEEIFNNFIKTEEEVINLIISILIIRHNDVYMIIDESYLSEVDDILKSQRLHGLIKKLKGDR